MPDQQIQGRTDQGSMFPNVPAFSRYPAGYGISTVLPGFDFETRSAAGYQWNEAKQKWEGLPGAPKTSRGLEVVGRRNYIMHPTFRVLSLAYDLYDGHGIRYWYPGMAGPMDLLDYIASGQLIEAWNAGYEFDVWNMRATSWWGWPVLHLQNTRCAMAKARAHAMPGKLDRFGKVANLTYQKDPAGVALLDKFTKPKKPTKKRKGFWIEPHDEPAEFARLLQYNGRDVLSEGEASLRTPDLSETELEIWLVDQSINLRGIQVDVVGLENCIAIVEQAYAKYNAELRTLTGGAVEAASELKELTRWLAGRGIHMDRNSLDEEAVDAMLAKLRKAGATQTAEYRVLELRGLLGSASIKKLYSFKHQNYLGRLYDLYTFFGARTGRWTGNGPQPQNLPSGIFHSLPEVEKALGVISHRCLELVEYYYPKNTALEVIASVLRGLLIAAPGYELICSDYTSIEGVITAALAGEEWSLEVFRTHGMIYEATAAEITGVPFDEFVKHRIDTGGVAHYENGKLMGIEGGAHHPLRKKLGKFAVLGSGFGGWIGAWKNFGADEYLSDPEIKQSILKWRAKSPMTVKLWGTQKREVAPWQYVPEYDGLEGAAVAAVRWPGKAFEYRGIAYQMSVQDDILYCRTPCGGFLTYHRPRLEPSTREWAQPWELSLSYEGDNKNPKMGPVGWVRMNLYGGKQTENVVQKLGRTVHASGLVNLERANYRPVLHSHDEPCGEVPVGWGTIEEFEALMTRIARTPGTFCYGWPIKAKGGWRGPRYGKFE